MKRITIAALLAFFLVSAFSLGFIAGWMAHP